MAVVIIPEKVCPHCGGIKYYQKISKGYVVYKCAKRVKEEQDRYRKSSKGKEKSKVSDKKYRSSEKGKTTRREQQKRYQHKLTDKYIISQLIDSEVRELKRLYNIQETIKDFINTKRKQLCLKRKLKQVELPN